MAVFMPHWPKPIGNRPINFIDLGLDRVLELSSRLGQPHLKIPNVIHVAGTNGKGSTIAFLKTILEESGYTVNTYTSPHLVHFNERIVLLGEKITDKFLYEILEECRAFADGIKITFFEGTTIAALLAFSKIKADFTILETGMGGRLDATNIVNPIISLITSISIDHVEHLGNTIEEIAYEKSGIIKKDSLSIISKQTKEALRVIEDYASNVGSFVYRAENEWNCVKSINGMVFSSGGQAVEYPTPSLRGDHQITNAGNAVACATMLHRKFGYTKITHESISAALVNTYWPARLEHLSFYHPFSDLCDIFLDGAHNHAGSITLSQWLNGRKAYIILGMTRGKDVEGFLSEIKDNIALLCSVCVQAEPRSHTAEEIAQFANGVNIDCIKHQDLESAIKYIIDFANPSKTDKALIVVCGSLFLAKDLYSLLGIDAVPG